MEGTVAGFVDDDIVLERCNSEVDICQRFGCERIDMHPGLRKGQPVKFLKITVEIAPVILGSAKPCIDDWHTGHTCSGKNSGNVGDYQRIQSLMDIGRTTRIQSLCKQYKRGCRFGVIALNIDYKNSHSRECHDAFHYAAASRYMVYL